MPHATHSDSKACDRSVCNSRCGRKEEGHSLSSSYSQFGRELHSAFVPLWGTEAEFGGVLCPGLKGVGIWAWPSPSVCNGNRLTNLPRGRRPNLMVASPVAQWHQWCSKRELHTNTWHSVTFVKFGKTLNITPNAGDLGARKVNLHTTCYWEIRIGCCPP